MTFSDSFRPEYKVFVAETDELENTYVYIINMYDQSYITIPIDAKNPVYLEHVDDLVELLRRWGWLIKYNGEIK